MGGFPPKNAGWRDDGWSVTSRAVYGGPYHSHVSVTTLQYSSDLESRIKGNVLPCPIVKAGLEPAPSHPKGSP